MSEKDSNLRHVAYQETTWKTSIRIRWLRACLRLQGWMQQFIQEKINWRKLHSTKNQTQRTTRQLFVRVTDVDHRWNRNSRNITLGKRQLCWLTGQFIYEQQKPTCSPTQCCAFFCRGCCLSAKHHAIRIQKNQKFIIPTRCLPPFIWWLPPWRRWAWWGSRRIPVPSSFRVNSFGSFTGSWERLTRSLPYLFAGMDLGLCSSRFFVQALFNFDSSAQS